jgi:hypothetical protein
VEYVRRDLPGVTVEFFKTFEPQKRGAQHAHVMFRFDGAVVDREVRAALRAAGERWDFGNIDIKPVDLTSGRAIARTAGYCAKYAAKCSDTDRAMIDTATGEVVRLHLRAWSKSAGWGDTMASIRAAQRTWAASAGVHSANAGGASAQPTGSEATLDLNCDFYTDAEFVHSVVDHVGASSAM